MAPVAVETSEVKVPLPTTCATAELARACSTATGLSACPAVPSMAATWPASSVHSPDSLLRVAAGRACLPMDVAPDLAALPVVTEEAVRPVEPLV